MPKRKEPELDPKEQFKRFQETAKELGVDESGKHFEKAFGKLTAKPEALRQTAKETRTDRRNKRDREE